jgi:hypothetical protein
MTSVRTAVTDADPGAWRQIRLAVLPSERVARELERSG